VLVLVIMDTVVVVLLAGLVAGLLRSHTEILRALRALSSAIDDALSERNGSSATPPAPAPAPAPVAPATDAVEDGETDGDRTPDGERALWPRRRPSGRGEP
jgi:hypothetical protein